MEDFRFKPYNRLSLTDSNGLVFTCKDEDKYKVTYNSQISGPKILKRQSESVVWTLFFGGIPQYMQDNEIRDRKITTLRRMTTSHEIILEELAKYAENVIFEGIDPLKDKEIHRKRRATVENVLYDPDSLGIAEHLIRPKVGMRIAIGLLIFNRGNKDKTLTSKLRTIVSDSPISEIYCLPE